MNNLLYKLILASIFSISLASGCSHVEPWERGRLAKPHMALDPEPTLTSLRDHVQVSKEATSGGSGTSGGGCGCN